MSRIRVLDLAKELNIDTKTALTKLTELGIQVKNHFNALTDSEADKMRVYIRSGKNPDKEAARSANKVIIRRRADVQSPSSDAGRDDAEGGAPLRGEPEAHTPPSAPAASFGMDAGSPVPTFSEAPRGAAPATPAFEETASDTEFLSRAPSNAVTSSPAPTVSHTPSVATSEVHAAVAAPPPSHPIDAPASAPAPGLDEGHAPPLSQQVPSVNQTGTTSPQANLSATVVRPGMPPAAGTAAVPPGGATVISRPPDGVSATIVRPAAQGAVILRRGEPGAGGPGAGGGVSTYRPQGPNQGGYRSDASLRGGFPQREGAFQPREGGGGFPRREGGPGGFPSGPRPAGPGGFRSADGAPRPGGFGAPGTGPRPGGFGPGAPRPDGRPPFGGPRPPGAGGPMGGGRFGAPPAPEPGTGKEGPSRSREKEKEAELRRRKLQEEERKAKGIGKGGGRHGESEFVDEEIYALDLPEGAAEGAEEIPQVRTVIPNRRRGGIIRRKDHKKHGTAPMGEAKRVIEVDENITVADLAAALAVKSSAVVKALMGLGMMASVNQVLDVETATLVSQEFGFEVKNTTVTISDILNTKKTAKTDTEKMEGAPRPPVITIMGHVDHGKTSLLDAIRAANVAGGEAGGITQHIGAYQIDYNGRKVTFLDTPGHEAFTQMRARGAQVTDVVVLVVAADDGVMPQTIEAIAHAKAAGVPVIVAMNKIDKPGVNIERIQRELSTQGVTPEEWGGESIFVPVSAKTKEGIPALLDALLLQADVQDLRAAPEGLASGYVIEAKLDKNRGPLATVLVTQGTLKVQDWVVAGTSYGRVRAMFDDRGNRLAEAPPATPVEILGLSEVPAAGDTFNCVVNDSIAKEAVAFRIEKQRQSSVAAQQKASLQDIMARLAVGDADKPKELPVIVKADTHGSVEAIRASLTKLDTEKVKNRIIHSAVGGITETDISLAEASGALILGFNVRPDRAASAVAEQKGVDIKVFSIIYELIDTVQSAMVGRLAPIKTEKVQGHAEVRNTFSVPKVGTIAGSAITDGKFTRNSHVRVVRDSIVIYTGRVGSLKRFKDDAKEVVQGFECGIGIEGYNDLRVGDVLESFVIEETAATL